MATDIDAIVSNIRSFHDMSGKAIIHVGAGGGKLIGYADGARSVLAVDPDPDAISQLMAAIERLDLEELFTVVQGEFESVDERADVVLFEFCLHEMEDPEAALLHARSLAPEVVVVDHAQESRWAWYACEEQKSARSWAAVGRLPVIREASFEAVQHFKDYTELLSKIEILGEQAVARIAELSGRDDIEIEMGYAMALIGKGDR
jgi:predicted RNA methylase